MKPFIILLLLSFLVGSFENNRQFYSLSEMVKVEGGNIKVEKKVYTVKTLLVDKYEVTMAEFEAFAKSTSYITVAERTGGARIWHNKQWEQAVNANWRHDLNGDPYPKDKYKVLPVSNISVEDAKAFAAWAGKRLPTLQEWVFIASGGNSGKRYKYAGSNKVDEVACYDENTFSQKQPVGSRQPNELGIYDLSGNVFEFVVDENGKYYARGGCYFSDPEFCEIKDKGWGVKSDETFHTYGFRCVKDL